MALNASLGQGYSSGGSVNSAYNYNNSMSENWAQSNSWTDAMSARQWSAMMADIAWERDMEAFQQQMNFNAEEAQKQRDWQEQMANTIYTRSVKNMRQAGINPILAANMGLSGAGVGSGATASIGGAPSAPLAQSFMDSFSASNAHGFGIGNGEGWSEGSSWNYSENGLATALGALGEIVSGALSSINAGQKIDIALSGLENWREETKQKTNDAIKNKDYNSPYYPHEPGRKPSGESIELTKKIVDFAEGVTKKLNGSGGGHSF